MSKKFITGLKVVAGLALLQIIAASAVMIIPLDGGAPLYAGICIVCSAALIKLNP